MVMEHCQTSPKGEITVCFNTETSRWESNDWLWQRITSENDKIAFHESMVEYFGTPEGGEWEEITPYDIEEWMSRTDNPLQGPLAFLNKDLYCIPNMFCIKVWHAIAVVGGLIVLKVVT